MVEMHLGIDTRLGHGMPLGKREFNPQLASEVSETLAKRLKVQRAKLGSKGMKILFTTTSSYDLPAMCKYASGRH